MSQPTVVDDVLRGVPSHGWVGRWDRALLVLSGVAGLSHPDIADLTTADVTISDGTARIRTRSATITVRSTDDTMLCGSCALARWLHVLDMTVIYPDGCVPAAVLARSAPLPDPPRPLRTERRDQRPEFPAGSRAALTANRQPGRPRVAVSDATNTGVRPASLTGCSRSSRAHRVVGTWARGCVVGNARRPAPAPGGHPNRRPSQ